MIQQTALNLIAIGVFGITLSVLLGPLFNISPAIPALATFGILSLTTLDSFSFQGKGVNLLLDSVAGISSQHRDRIIRHEAGHFLVAHLLGIPITGYTLSAWEAFKQKQPGLGGVTFDNEQLSPDVLDAVEMRLTLERFCNVWMAGIAAENLVYGNAEGGAEDREKLTSALMALGRPISQCQQQEKFAQLQAKTLIEENWLSYQALVTAMEKRASVAECYKVIQEPGN